MSASTDPALPGGVLAAAWRPAGVLYLGFLLAGLASGLWHDAIFPSRDSLQPAPLPVLQSLAVAQVAFVLLAYPMVLLRRSRRTSGVPAASVRTFWPETIVESSVYLLLAVPFYAVGAYLADATATDAVRTGLYLAGLLPLAWAAGAHFTDRRRGTSIVVLLLAITALGVPAAYYIALEFFPSGSGRWLRELAPATFAWRTGAARQDWWLPWPRWPWLLWPAVATVAISASLMVPKPDGPPGLGLGPSAHGVNPDADRCRSRNG